MKKVLFFTSVIIVFFVACNKESSDYVNPPDPPMYAIIKSDTITTGNLWNLRIGDIFTSVYTAIQNDTNIHYLSILNNSYTNLNDIKDRICLYSAIYMDETIGTSSGIQIYFKNNKVESIWTNDGKKLNTWPAGFNHSVNIGDSIDNIFENLVSIKKVNQYAKKLERISLFTKDIFKPFDNGVMDTSKYWQLTSNIDGGKTLHNVTLRFTNNKLDTIYNDILGTK